MSVDLSAKSCKSRLLRLINLVIRARELISCNLTTMVSGENVFLSICTNLDNNERILIHLKTQFLLDTQLNRMRKKTNTILFRHLS